FKNPEGVAIDANGILYVADTGNETIRRIATDGSVTTLAGLAGAAGKVDGVGASARFSAPARLTLDASGNLYVADNGGVRKVTPAGVVTTVRDGATLLVAVDSAGNLYTNASDASIQRTTPAGATSTVVGAPPKDRDRQQPAYEAFAMDAQGNFYTAERLRFSTLIQQGFGVVRKFNAQGVQLASAEAVVPTGLALDGSGKLFASCGGVVGNQFPSGTTTGCSSVIAYDANLAGTTLAGISQVLRTPPNYAQGAGSADGPGTLAQFNFPKGIDVSARGIYVADTGNHTIRRIEP
ncbi:MAG: hypothetical protein EOO54_22005, partial [Haliea sp.]